MLQKLHPLVDDVLACTICLLLPQVSVGPDDVLQLVREIVLTPESTPRDTKPKGIMNSASV